RRRCSRGVRTAWTTTSTSAPPCSPRSGWATRCSPEGGRLPHHGIAHPDVTPELTAALTPELTRTAPPTRILESPRSRTGDTFFTDCALCQLRPGPSERRT